MKGVTTFLITVNKYDVPKMREEIRNLGYIWTEQDWTPRTGCNVYRKQKRMVQNLEDTLMDAFCSVEDNKQFLKGE